MDRLVLCGRFKSDSPADEDTCNSQSALDFVTCSNHRPDVEDEVGAKHKNRSNLNKICRNQGQAMMTNGCQPPAHCVDLEVRSSKGRSRSPEMGKSQQSTPLSKSTKSPGADKTKAKPDEFKCWTGFFDDDDDDDDDDVEDSDDCSGDKENNYHHHHHHQQQHRHHNRSHHHHHASDYGGCVNRKKHKDSDHHRHQQQQQQQQQLSTRRDSERDVRVSSSETPDVPGEERICYVSNLTERFSVVRKIGSGTFGSVFLAVRLSDQRKVALKKLPKDRTKVEDFCLEFRYGRQFSRHPCVLETSPVAYVTKTWYVLVQEYAPMSDLLRSVPPRVGLPEVAVKSVARQVAGAVEFIHARQVVHRDLKLENILVFQDQGDRMLTRVKLGDFGVARKVGTMVCKVCDGTTYTPPEICSLTRHAYYRVERSADVWSLGVVIFCLMTGSFPWQLADISVDPLFQSFARWQTRRTPVVPEHWARFSPALRSLFQRYLEIRPIKRAEVSVLQEFLDAPWSSVTGNPLEGGSTNTSGVISTCNASGSASTLTCQSSNLHHRLSNSSASSSATCSLSHHYHYPHLHHHHHHHSFNPHGTRKSSQCHGSSDRVSHNSESSCRSRVEPTNRVAPAAMLDDVYKNNPLKTSGALHSPLVEDEIHKGQSAVFCGKRQENSESEAGGQGDAESQMQVRRCHHHHHHDGSCQEVNASKCKCRHLKKAKPPNPPDKNSMENVSGQRPEDTREDLDAETKFRLERVNRWIMNQMT